MMIPADGRDPTSAAPTEAAADDIAALVASRDLIGLGALADERRRQRHGNRVTFVRVQEVSASSDGLQLLAAAGELRIIGEPPTDGREATAAVERVVAVGASIPVTAFALHELAMLCSDDAVSLRRLLVDLREAGLAMVSEARADLPRALEWLEVSHAADVDVARLTVGDPGVDDGVTLARQISAWGPSVAHVHAFAPLPSLADARATTGYRDARAVALARLLVENIGSIQVDWSAYGPKLAQVALTFGADDVDGVSAVDSLEDGRRRVAIEEIRRNIEGASLVPIQRNGRFETVDGW